MNFLRQQKYNYVIFLIVILVLFTSYKSLSNEDTPQNVHAIREDLHIEFNSGLLIGFRNDLDKTTTYRTLWIAPYEKLTLYPTSNNVIGKAALEINLGKNETMIMAQWINGDIITQWTEIFNESLPLLE